MQADTLHVWELVNDLCEEVPGHIGLWLELLIGPWAGGAEQIAAVRDFQVQTYRLLLNNDRQLSFAFFKVPGSGNGSGCQSCAHNSSGAETSREASCGANESAALKISFVFRTTNFGT